MSTDNGGLAMTAEQPRLIGWRMADYTAETNDPDKAKNWSANVPVLPIFEGDPNTKLCAPQQAAQPAEQPKGEAYPAVFSGRLLGRHVGLHGSIESIEALEAYIDAAAKLYDAPPKPEQAVGEGVRYTVGDWSLEGNGFALIDDETDPAFNPVAYFPLIGAANEVCNLLNTPRPAPVEVGDGAKMPERLCVFPSDRRGNALTPAQLQREQDHAAGWNACVEAFERANPRPAVAAVGDGVVWQSMRTAPRDGSVVLLRWGEDVVMPGWWDYPVSPVQNDDGTWPEMGDGFPWAFIDAKSTECGHFFVNHAADTKYGPTHWAPYNSLAYTPRPASVEVGGGVDDVSEKILQALHRYPAFLTDHQSLARHLAAAITTTRPAVATAGDGVTDLRRQLRSFLARERSLADIPKTMVDAGVAAYKRETRCDMSNGLMRVLLSESIAALAAHPVEAAHPDDLAVDAFATAMKAKLAVSRAKGRSGWNGEDASNYSLSVGLRHHVLKGDPVDVANFAMFLHQRGEAILPVEAARGELVHKIKERVEHFTRVGKAGGQYTDGRRHEAQLILDLCNATALASPIAPRVGVPDGWAVIWYSDHYDPDKTTYGPFASEKEAGEWAHSQPRSGSYSVHQLLAVAPEVG